MTVHSQQRTLWETVLSVLNSWFDVLRELNPMLGHRGCRLGISYPEITEMQARAIFESTAKLINEKVFPFPEVMVPLVGSVTELKNQKKPPFTLADVEGIIMLNHASGLSEVEIALLSEISRLKAIHQLVNPGSASGNFWINPILC